MNQLSSLTRAIIDIESVSKNEAELLEFIRKNLPLDMRIAYDNNEVLLATTERIPGNKFVVLAGHTDTVPIDNNFPSNSDGEVIFGRGASDMKSGLAVMIELANLITNYKKPLDLDFGFLFFSREEITPEEGTLIPALKNCEELRSADFAILMEPTNNDIELGCLGNLNLTLLFKGITTHSARPWNGINAAHLAIRTLENLASDKVTDIDIDGLIYREVANITRMSGGIARNMITPELEVDINVRYAPNRDPQEIEREWISKFLHDDIEVLTIHNAHPAPIVMQHEIVQRLKSAGGGNFLPKQAWTNTADFAFHGIPAINFGPGDPKYAHRQNEQVTINALADSLQTMIRFAAGTSK